MIGTGSSYALCGIALNRSVVALQIVLPEGGHVSRLVELCVACDGVVASLIELRARTPRICDEHAAA